MEFCSLKIHCDHLNITFNDSTLEAKIYLPNTDRDCLELFLREYFAPNIAVMLAASVLAKYKTTRVQAGVLAFKEGSAKINLKKNPKIEVRGADCSCFRCQLLT